MKSFWGILFCIALVACSSPPVVITPDSTPAIVSTNTVVVSLESPTGVVPSESVPPTDITSVPTSIAPEVKTIAPDIREVELSDLGLNQTTRLILYYQPSESLLIMSAQDSQPKKIPNIASDAWLFIGIDISPDHKWFIYEVTKATYTDYWISSIDGQEQKIAVPNARGRTSVRWATNEQIELWRYPDEGRSCPKRELIVNPFTQEILNSPEVPRSIKHQCFSKLTTSPDHSKIVYLNEHGLWSIYDFDSAQSQNVFPWLSKSERFALWPEYIHWSTDGITFILPGQETVDLIIDLPISDASKNDIALRHILLPDRQKISNEAFSWWTLEEHLVGFDLIDTDYNYLEGGDASPPSNFVILDFKNFVLYDYNLDRAKIDEVQKVVSPFIFPSADNRFIAWTIYEPPSMGTALETVVLNRETGQIARIKGFEFYGWGEIGHHEKQANNACSRLGVRAAFFELFSWL